MTATLTSSETITANVAAMYERRPYPHYPLLMRPRWQDGYLVSSLFARSLPYYSRNRNDFIAGPPAQAMLIAGCGEILPYIIRRWEPIELTIDAVDLSARSISRSRFRTSFTRGSIDYFKQDILTFLSPEAGRQQRYYHIETFGMLHHMADPEAGIRALASSLVDGGSMRVMVYNSTARDWIHRLQDLFESLGIDDHSDELIVLAKEGLTLLAQVCDQTALRLKQTGPSLMGNNTRFVDTFLHPHELRHPVSWWLAAFRAAGLVPIGIFDRLGEFDDLPNPLWQLPSDRDLESRAIDRRFENNLEIFLIRPTDMQRGHTGCTTIGQPPASLRWKGPPMNWFTFPETKDLSFSQRRQVWTFFLEQVASHGPHELPAHLRKLPLRCLQRLARLGALNRVSASYPNLSEPIEAKMDPPHTPPRATFADLANTDFARWVARTPRGRNFSESKISEILRALAASPARTQ